jgi:hypothetical protein
MMNCALPPCPWCRKPARVWRHSGGGWFAGCDNPEYAASPVPGCVVNPHTLAMTTRAAAIREWKRGFRCPR